MNIMMGLGLHRGACHNSAILDGAFWAEVPPAVLFPAVESNWSIPFFTYWLSVMMVMVAWHVTGFRARGIAAQKLHPVCWWCRPAAFSARVLTTVLPVARDIIKVPHPPGPGIAGARTGLW